MNQIRFNIGVPKAGSAARMAEDAAGSPLRSIVPRAGSAARDAEERKKAEGAPMQRPVAFTMRAGGGVVGSTPSEQAVPSPKPVIERSQQIRTLPVADLEHSTISTLSPLHSERTESGVASSGALQTAVARLKSMFESLFPPGSGSSTHS